MNLEHYENIYKTFEAYHPDAARNAVDYRPNSSISIRISTKDGNEYDFDVISKGLRRVEDVKPLDKEEVTDEMCRKSFAIHLYDMMVKKGFNQQTLADYTGISKGAINGYINETKTPSLTNVRKIAYVLCCSVAELID